MALTSRVGCGRAALNGKGGAHVVEGAASGRKFIASVCGFQVLREVIELHVSAGDHDRVSSLYST